ncbi:MAG: hypothetical protein J1E85_06320 [Ruminococcus sp.]|nr:hypothetical protein [Ruminococcus sp.]
MKKILIISIALFSLLSLSSCAKKDKADISIPNTASSDTIAVTTVNVEAIKQDYANLENEYNALEEKYNDMQKIYDSRIRDNIITYCNNMLTYTDNISADNIIEVKDIVTDIYYDELQSYLGHIQSNEKFEQACGLETLYYSDNSIPSDSVDIIAICKKTTIYKDDVATETVAYRFNMKYQSENWRINSVELLF